VASTLQEARNNLARAAAAFGGSEWDNLVLAMRAYDQQVQKLFVQSPVELLQVVQGRAQASTQLLEVFEQAKQIAETARLKEIKKP
jgi:hypothetical protein